MILKSFLVMNKNTIHKSEFHRILEQEWRKAIEKRESFENNNKESKIKIAGKRQSTNVGKKREQTKKKIQFFSLHKK
jgi:hypothetical protein